MSGKLTGMVFDRYPEGGGEMLLALKLADNAHDDGTHIFPSVDTMAEKTRQSRRAVQYQLKKMRDAGWLILVRAARGGRNGTGRPAEYRISADWIKGADFASLKLSTGTPGTAEKGADSAPNESEMGANGDTNGCNPEQERVQNEAEMGAKLLHTNHQLTVIEPSAAATSARGEEKTAAAANSKKANVNPDPETELTELLIALELDRGQQLIVDRSRDRAFVLTWIGKGVLPEQLREAHKLAVAARKRDSDDRPTYAGFVAPFVDEVLAAAARAAGATRSPTDDIAWFESPEGVDARAAELKHRDRKPDEDWRYFRVLVVKASNDRRAAEFVLRDATKFNAADLYQFARRTFGDALMPVDDYAS